MKKVSLLLVALFVFIPQSAFSQVLSFKIDWHRLANNYRLVQQNREADSLGVVRPENWDQVRDLLRNGNLVYMPQRGCGYRVIDGTRILSPVAEQYFRELFCTVSKGLGRTLRVASALRTKEKQRRMMQDARYPNAANPDCEEVGLFCAPHPTGWVVDVGCLLEGENFCDELEKRLREHEVRGEIHVIREYFPPHLHLAARPQAQSLVTHPQTPAQEDDMRPVSVRSSDAEQSELRGGRR